MSMCAAPSCLVKNFEGNRDDLLKLLGEIDVLTATTSEDALRSLLHA